MDTSPGSPISVVDLKSSFQRNQSPIDRRLRDRTPLDLDFILGDFAVSNESELELRLFTKKSVLAQAPPVLPQRPLVPDAYRYRVVRQKRENDSIFDLGPCAKTTKVTVDEFLTDYNAAWNRLPPPSLDQVAFSARLLGVSMAGMSQTRIL
jgi:hypothetical protein